MPVYITITAKTKEDMISQYNFTRKQQEALDTLLEQDEVLISAAQSLAVSDRAAQDILKKLPDTLPVERKKVIKAACSLVGKVNYFWGGKIVRYRLGQRMGQAENRIGGRQ